jgi:hypothetical protein
MRLSVHRWYAGALCAALFASAVGADAGTDDGVERLKAGLAASASATQFLTDRCTALKLAAPPVIRALRETTDLKPSAEVRAAVQVGADTPLRYRRVDLTCGDHVLSQADNWYVPARLTPEMNHTLDSSEAPFGAVVKPLNFHRQTLKTEALDDPAHSLRVTAVLLTPDGVPFSLVVENYSRELTAAPR